LKASSKSFAARLSSALGPGTLGTGVVEGGDVNVGGEPGSVGSPEPIGSVLSAGGWGRPIIGCVS
jgi:hypothetical protein